MCCMHIFIGAWVQKNKGSDYCVEINVTQNIKRIPEDFIFQINPASEKKVYLYWVHLRKDTDEDRTAEDIELI